MSDPDSHEPDRDPRRRRTGGDAGPLARARSVLGGIAVRLRAFVRREAADAELDDEIRFHIEMATRQLVEGGVDPVEARRRALIEFGGVERFKEHTRRERSLPVMDELIRNLRFAARRLRARPVHSLAVVGTLALGIGATTAIFSVVDAVILEPSPFPAADRLVMIWETDRDSGTSHEPASWPDIRDFQDGASTLAGIGGFMGAEITVLEGDVPERVSGVLATPSFFRTLGIQPLAGRLFSEGEGATQVPYPLVLLGEEYWRTRFAADPDIVGREISLTSGPATVVGIVPADADFGLRQIQARADYGTALRGEDVHLWLAMQPSAEVYPRQTHPFFTVGRLDPAADLSSASEELAAIATDLERDYEANRARGVNLESYSDVVLGPARSALLILMGAVGLVLLVACVNVANLLLTETSARHREVALRRAFGADGGQIGRQFLVESLLLTGVGAALGVVLAYGGLEVLLAFAPADLPRLELAAIDLRVLTFAAGLAGAVGLVFGFLPALQSRRKDLQDTLKTQASRGATEGRGVRRTRSGLVVSEVALAVALVVSAGILTRSFWELQSVDPGFRTEEVVKARYSLPPRYSEMAEVAQLHARFLEEARRIPGVESVALASNHPLEPGSTNSFVITGREAESADLPEIRTRFISPEYPEVLRIPILEGRSLDENDISGMPTVALVNQATAERYFPDGGAVGQEIRFWGIGWRIVGVMGDEQFQGVDRAVDPAIYVPLMQIPTNTVNLLLRSEREPTAVAADAGRILRTVDPEMAVTAVESMEAVLEGSLARPRFLMLLLGVFGVLAVTLALIGVYGVLSQAVARRGPEVGIRLAMGASQADLVREVVTDGLRVTAVGVAVGAVIAVATSRLLEGLVYGVSVTDVTTYIAVIAAVLLLAALASLLPAVRAARTDPVGLLRAE